MADLKADIVVLGAGMVGVGAALPLQKRGRNVMLVDKHRAAGEETSYGNAGIIESASVFLRTFPRDFRQILRYATIARRRRATMYRICRSFCPGCCVTISPPRRSRAAWRDGPAAADPPERGRA